VHSNQNLDFSSKDTVIVVVVERFFEMMSDCCCYIQASQSQPLKIATHCHHYLLHFTVFHHFHFSSCLFTCADYWNAASLQILH